MTVAVTEVRRLDRAALPACLRLAQGRGWPAEIRAWDLLFEVGAVYGVYGTAVDTAAGAGELAGAVGAARYGATVTTIGGMLVAESHAGQGLGGRLLRHAVDRAPAETVWLTATPQGRPLYERFGFRDVGILVRCTGTPVPTAGTRGPTRVAGPDDLPDIVALDGEVFGADRSGLLRRLFAVATQTRIVDGPRGPRGYAMAWDAVGATAIGPVVADDPETAAALLTGLTDRAGGPVRFDVGAEQRALLAWARRRGLHQAVSTTVMIYGRPLPGDRSRLFTPATGALG
ncbi:GNAT family N-acetyltransferase [Streptomyces sudanensis]|uniref:GNAT family N-acetyltransferase n=1 Tax=Streptomyces sudanensis TaxID=436397 RepID=UPI0020CE31DD|nr:GNAT family N-acetyltransferase [Streptomyces sudanensis]MCP9958678.1 GNAT family N-acetyltransferase [Streptomyces sudanensis]MCQ0000827.1 GNAT family N-acetyltransferase [Streptomyces sudanensis]